MIRPERSEVVFCKLSACWIANDGMHYCTIHKELISQEFEWLPFTIGQKTPVFGPVGQIDIFPSKKKKTTVLRMS